MQIPREGRSARTVAGTSHLSVLALAADADVEAPRGKTVAPTAPGQGTPAPVRSP